MPSFVRGMFAGILVGIGISVVTIALPMKRAWRKAVIKHGAAEYIMNPETGETTWQWKNQEKEDEP